MSGSMSGTTTTLDGSALPTLPPQYSTGNLGFFTRQTEPVTTSVVVGPDGALYVGELTGIPYPDGFANVVRIADPTAVPGFNGVTPSGVPQTYASGFSQIQSLAFDAQGDMYVLDYVNSANVYDPTQNPATLPPSQLIKVAPDGTRTTVSGPELKLGNFVTVDKTTGDVYVAINNASNTNGEVLKYSASALANIPAGGSAAYTVVASGLEGPRGMAFGPDGNLYVVEAGVGTPSSSPDAATAPVIPFIPGLVSERGGTTGGITKITIGGAGGQQRVLSGLSSFQEFNPTTGQDRVIGIGANGLTITPDGTVYIASGGGLAPETAVAVGPLADTLQGVLKVTGLFGANPAAAVVTPEFNALKYAAANGPDGATTLFNTESNLYDITVGADGKLYTVDAARNLVYGLTNAGRTLDSVTVVQPPAATPPPPPCAAEVAAGGDPTAAYNSEIANPTPVTSVLYPATAGATTTAAVGTASGTSTTDTGTAGAGGVGGGAGTVAPVTVDPSAAASTGTALATPPGSADPAAAVPVVASAPTSGTATAPASTTPAPATPDPTTAAPTTPDPTTADPTMVVPREPTLNTGGASLPLTAPPADPTAAAGVPGGAPGGDMSLASGALPGPTDPTSPPVLASNPYATYVDPFFGNFAPAAGEPLTLPAGHGGSYDVSNVYSFGDRLADNGGTYSESSLLTALTGTSPNSAAPYYNGGTSDGPEWTDDLTQILGTPTTGGADNNYAYSDATARLVDNAASPFQTAYNFAGQINLMQETHQTVLPTDLVTVNFGGNDITFVGADSQKPGGMSADSGIQLSVDAIISGMQKLADMGAKHFLVSNAPDISMAPIFNDAAFKAMVGGDFSIYPKLVDTFNADLGTALHGFALKTGLDVKELDLNSLFKGIAADPSAYGFSNLTQPILANPPIAGTTPVYNPAIVGQDPTVRHSSLFLNPFFAPTALGQALMAETARDTLSHSGVSV